MTTPEDTERPREPEWVEIPDPPAGNRTESDVSDEDRGRPLGAWVLGGGIAAALGGVGLFQSFGSTGLAAGAVTAAGGGAVYGYHKVRNRDGAKTPRTRRSKPAFGPARKGGPKLGRGKGPNLLGGKGAKLGGKGGPKLGKGGGPKLGGKSSKLFSGGKGPKLGSGKAGRLLGGKSGKLGGGRSGKLGGGRGSKLGGKLGRKTTSRLGSVGKSGGRLLGRGGKAGAGIGARGGKLLGGKGKAGIGRWGKSTAGGAGILGRSARKLGGKAGAAALRTKAGQRASRGFKAAKAVMRSTMPGEGRWKNMRDAARGAMGSPRNPFAQWTASIAAALLALTAMGHDKWKRRQAERNKRTAEDPAEAKKPPGPEAPPPGDGEKRTRERDLNRLRLADREEQLRRLIEEFEKLRAEGLIGPKEEVEHEKWRAYLERQIEDLRRVISEETAGTSEPGVIHPTRIHPRRTMTAFPLAAGAAEMNAAAAAHAPQSMLQVANELDQFGEVPTQVALAVRTYTMRLESDYPIHAAVVEKTQEFAIAVAQLKALADEIGPLFRQVHAKDLERFEAPRTNEQAWDVSSV